MTPPKKRRKPEEILQKQCVQWFRLQYPKIDKRFFAIPNGGSRNIIEAVNLKESGVTPGVSDLFLSIARHGFNGFYLETKAPKGRHDPEQIEFQKQVESEGYKYILFRSFDKFRNEINAYLK